MPPLQSIKKNLVRSLYWSALLTLNVCITNFSFSQGSDLYYDHYTIREGLSSNRISYLYQDSRGLLWIGTEDGLNFYDGDQFRRIFPSALDSPHLRSDNIKKIAEDKNHDILFRSGDGVCVYHWNTKRIRILFSDSANNMLHRINDFFVDKKKEVWLISKSELLHYNAAYQLKKSWRLDTIKVRTVPGVTNSESFLCEDQTGNIWFYYKNTLNELEVSTGIIHNFYNNPNQFKLFLWNARSLMEDHEGNFWLSSRDSLIRYNPTQKKLQAFQFTDKDLEMHAVLLSTSGFIWLISPKYTLISFNIATKKFFQYPYNASVPNSVSAAAFSSLLEDNYGNMWIGGSTGLDRVFIGSKCFNTIMSFSRSEKNGNLHKIQLNDFLTYKDEIFVSAYEGEFKVNANNFSVSRFLHLKKNSSAPENFFYMHAMIDSNQLLVSRWPGLDVFNLKSKVFTPKPFAYEHPKLLDSSGVFIAKVFRDSYHLFWISLTSDHGLLCWNRSTNKFVHYGVNESGYQYFPLRHFFSAAEDDSGNIWMGYDKGGITIFSRKQELFVNLPIVQSDPLNKYEVNCIMNDHQGHIWISTSNGLIKYSVSENKYRRYSRIDGLPTNVVFGLAMDKNNNIWMGSSAGISCLNIKTEKFSNFNQSNGIIDGETYKLVMDSVYNRMYYLTKYHLGYFVPDSIVRISSVISPIITSFKVLGIERMNDLANGLPLNANENVIFFEFTAPDLMNARNIHYQYKLDGLADIWHSVGNVKTAYFTNVRPGTYKFKVKAANEDGTWGQESISKPFTILPPWWQTLWFRIASLIFIVAFIVLVTRFFAQQRLRRRLAVLEKQRAIEHERHRISRDMHDELGSGISMISMITDLIKKEHLTPKVEGNVNKISIASHELVHQMRELVWTLNPQNDHLKDLLVYLRHYTMGVFENTPIECNVKLPLHIPDYAVGGELRRSLFLVVKESLNNLLKHAQARHATIDMHIENDYLCITITDDGIGLTNARRNQFGNGLGNMEKRMKEIMGSFQINSTHGTSIQLRVPLKIEAKQLESKI